MKSRSDIHVHSTFCDGADTPAEVAEAALRQGYTDIGFSSHSPFPQDPTCPGVADEAAYRAAIGALKEQYAGRLHILCGIEQEMRQPVDAAPYDYVIGSCHYVRNEDGKLAAVDANPEEVRALFGADMLRLAKEYYRHVAESVLRLKPDVVGHFDLIAKFNGEGKLFDETDKRYQGIALETFAAVLEEQNKRDALIEVNVGAMVSGYRNVPYPAPFLLSYAAQHRARAIITGDCHKKARLSAGVEEARQQMRACGFRQMVVLRGGQFVEVPLLSGQK